MGDFMRSVETCFTKHGYYGLSLFSFPGMDAHAIAVEVGVVREETGHRLMPHRSMRQAQIGALRALAYQLDADNCPRGHVTLKFDGEPTETDWKVLDSAFLPAEDNPIAL